MSEKEHDGSDTGTSNIEKSVAMVDQLSVNDNADNNDKSSTVLYTKEDLIDLVKAVKFSNPEASIRTVHREITEKMSLNESFAFLKDVKLNDVKKVWKKANASLGENKKLAENNNNASENKLKTNNDDSNNQILKFYTVGDGSIQMLAQNYSDAEAAKAAEVALSKSSKEKALHEEELKKYVHFFLDVPGDRSGKRPHQAIINFNDNNNELNAGGKKGKSKKKFRIAKGTLNKNPSEKAVNDDAVQDEREIVKIQVAAALPGMETLKTPMLLYNSNRTAKTFIHSPDESKDQNENDDCAYEKIYNLIREKGVSGALGVVGGTKGYFYCRISRRKNGQDIISVDVTSGLAPEQSW